MRHPTNASAFANVLRATCKACLTIRAAVFGITGALIAALTALVLVGWHILATNG